MKPRLAAALALVLAGCTASTPTVTPTGTPTGTLPPTSTPTNRPPPSRAVRAAVAGDDRVFLYEVARDELVDLVVGGDFEQPHWLSRNELAVAQRSGSGSTIRVIDISSRGTRDLAILEGALFSYDVSPDGSVLAAMLARDGLFVVDLHYLVGDRAVHRLTTMPVEGRGTNLEDEFSVEFSPDGRRVLVVHTANPGGTEDMAALQVRRLDGTLEYWVDADRAPTAAAWLPTGGLVFRSRDGVRRWKPGASSSVGVGSLTSWYAPWPAPTGRAVVYDTGRYSRRVQVRRVRLSDGAVTDVGPPGRANPVFAATNEVWMQIVQRCEPDCEAPVVPGPVVYAVNPNNGRERTLRLPTLQGIAVWYEQP